MDNVNSCSKTYTQKLSQRNEFCNAGLSASSADNNWWYIGEFAWLFFLFKLSSFSGLIQVKVVLPEAYHAFSPQVSLEVFY